MAAESRLMIVTGGSRGIGAAVAMKAAAAGYRVVVNYASDASGAAEVVAAIERQGGCAGAIQADISRLDEVRRLFDEVDRHFGTPDVLVNNAGITGRPQPIERLEEEMVTKVLATNVAGTIWCTGEAVRRMSVALGGKGGVILLVSSAAARHGGVSGALPYTASKGAIDSFTIGLAKEVGSVGIRVAAVRPGFIDTSIHRAAGLTDEMKRTITASIPLGRIGNEAEAAAAILWLASEDASYVHGAILDVSGGR